MLRQMGLDPTLAAHCRETGRRHHVDVTYNAAGDIQAIRGDTAVCVFRVSQEALRNAIAHGHASHVTVSVAATKRGVELAVADDGKGFEPAEARRNGAGLGLVSMEERAHLAGGDLTIASRPGNGTVISLRLPYPLAADAVASSGDVAKSDGSYS